MQLINEIIKMDIKDFMNEKFTDLAERDLYEQNNAKFTVTLKAGHKFMLEEIAANLEMSLTSLSGELLENLTDEMARELSIEKLEEACNNAEAKTLEYLKKTYPQNEYKGEVTLWPHFLRCYKGEYDK